MRETDGWKEMMNFYMRKRMDSENVRKTATMSVKEQMPSSEYPRESNSEDKCAESEALSYEGMTGLPWVIFQSSELFVSDQRKQMVE